MNISDNLCNILHKLSYSMDLDNCCDYLKLNDKYYNQLLKSNDYKSWKLNKNILTKKQIDNAICELQEFVCLQKSDLIYENILALKKQVVMYHYPDMYDINKGLIITVYIEDIYKEFDGGLPKMKMYSMKPSLTIQENIDMNDYNNEINKFLYSFETPLSSYYDYNDITYNSRYSNNYNGWRSYNDYWFHDDSNSEENDNTSSNDEFDNIPDNNEDSDNEISYKRDIREQSCAFKLWIPKYLYYKITHTYPSDLIKNDEIFMEYKYNPDNITKYALADDLFSECMLYKSCLDFNNDNNK